MKRKLKVKMKELLAEKGQCLEFDGGACSRYGEVSDKFCAECGACGEPINLDLPSQRESDGIFKT
jgi:hypothetical protein